MPTAQFPATSPVVSQSYDSISSLPDPPDSGAGIPFRDDDLPELHVPSSPRLPREGVLLGMVCLALAAVLQFLRLGRREVFSDEFYTLDVLAGGLTESYPDAIFSGHLPLYYWLMEGWSRLADIAAVESEWLLRLPSALFALLTCVVFFFHARRYLRGIAFAVAMLLIALNPVLVAAAHDATPFALLALTVALTHHYGVRALDEGGPRTWVPWALCVALGSLTHPLFWFLPIAQFAFALTRPQRTPRPFYVISIAGIALALAAAVAAVLYSEAHFPKRLDVRPPAIDDLIKGLVAVTLGDFPRHGVNSFFRAVMYLLFLVSIGLSAAYYRVRAMEASAMPEGIGWIDQTQDVVGTWRRLSLSSFLAYQWFTFLIPAAAALFLGTFVPRYDLDPEQLIICLPSLAVLLATGVDFAHRRGGKLSLALAFVLVMAYYDLRAITFHGYGVRLAHKLIKNEGFNPDEDVLVFSATSEIERTVRRYLNHLDPIGLPAPETEQEDIEIQQKARQVAEGRKRVFAIYHRDRRRVNKRDLAPVRTAFSEGNGWKVDNKWDISPEADSELRVYERMDAGAE